MESVSAAFLDSQKSVDIPRQGRYNVVISLKKSNL